MKVQIKIPHLLTTVTGEISIPLQLSNYLAIHPSCRNVLQLRLEADPLSFLLLSNVVVTSVTLGDIITLIHGYNNKWVVAVLSAVVTLDGHKHAPISKSKN